MSVVLPGPGQPLRTQEEFEEFKRQAEIARVQLDETWRECDERMKKYSGGDPETLIDTLSILLSAIPGVSPIVQPLVQGALETLRRAVKGQLK